MYKKTITYKDYNDEERTEDFYFNLSRAEVTQMELATEGGLGAMIERITKAKDIPAIMDVFKDLILRSYGQKSPDGRRFIKSKALSEEFSQTEAYSNLFMELATDANAASTFVNSIMPSDQKPAANSSLEIVD